MDPSEILTKLQQHFTPEFKATRESGLQTMAELIVKWTDITHEQAVEWLRVREEMGQVTFVPMPAPPSMLEAARYGTIPATHADEGYWSFQV